MFRNQRSTRLRGRYRSARLYLFSLAAPMISLCASALLTELLLGFSVSLVLLFWSVGALTLLAITGTIWAWPR